MASTYGFLSSIFPILRAVVEFGENISLVTAVLLLKSCYLCCREKASWLITFGVEAGLKPNARWNLPQSASPFGRPGDCWTAVAVVSLNHLESAIIRRPRAS